MTGQAGKESDFATRHIGVSGADLSKMLKTLGVLDLEELCRKVIPKEIITDGIFDMEEPLCEVSMLNRAKRFSMLNRVDRSFLGTGYYRSNVPSVIRRNVWENPGWYSSYTPYQSEISQGRLEALFTFQTMICELTGFPVANAGLLDESSAAAEAMAMSLAVSRSTKRKYFVDRNCHPQTIDVLQGRAEGLGLEIQVGDWREFSGFDAVLGALLQYPGSDGRVEDYKPFAVKCQSSTVVLTVACDLLGLCMLRTPVEIGADIAVGSSQRFGVSPGFGGPYAAFFATRDKWKRFVPGRIVGLSKDRQGKRAYRLALQTREQHIKRERATSNICTSQALLAVMAAFYAVYHGPKGLNNIARRVHGLAAAFASGVLRLGIVIESSDFFDTVCIRVTPRERELILKRCGERRIALRCLESDKIGISFDETHVLKDVEDLLELMDLQAIAEDSSKEALSSNTKSISDKYLRSDSYMSDVIFHKYHSETEMMRYLKCLENKDISLVHSMIPLGSCTMKLNGTSELIPLSWDEYTEIHPFAGEQQAQGYLKIVGQLKEDLKVITGFSGVSLQPNSGAQGEYAGMKVIRAYHHSRGDYGRNVCLIPGSAHGTNPASAFLAGFKVVAVKCDELGNIDWQDLQERVDRFSESLGAIMVTYPSTHGVFERGIVELCDIIHNHGGQVYLDGANMNAQLGLCRPADYGVDVCHLNLHKTFSIPHGGGGPGAGPICVAEHLVSFLPGHIFGSEAKSSKAIPAVSAAPYGNASILAISWSYIKMMGALGLKRATQIAILNANYIAHRLRGAFDLLYAGEFGFVAHECIFDMRPFKKSAGVTVFDIAKRLMDYGFHAPTVSFPVAGTMMVEPTESESKEELDRFCEAMLSIRDEIRQVECGQMNRSNNPLVNAPHTVESIASGLWDHPYSREQAVFPLPWLRERKFWPTVARVDEAFGDRNFCCSLS